MSKSVLVISILIFTACAAIPIGYAYHAGNITYTGVDVLADYGVLVDTTEEETGNAFSISIPFSPPSGGKIYLKDAMESPVIDISGSQYVKRVAYVSTQYFELIHTASGVAEMKIDATLSGNMFTSQGLHLVAKIGAEGTYHELSSGCTSDLGSVMLSYNVEKGSYNAGVRIVYGMYLEGDYINTSQWFYRPTIELNVRAEMS